MLLLSRTRATVLALTASMAVVAGAAPVARAAEWQAPEDGVVTDKQFTGYTAAFTEYLEYLKAAGKAMEGSKTGIGSLAVLSQMDEKTKAIVAKHGLTHEEFNWVGNQLWQAWGETAMSEMLDKAEADFAEQLKGTDEKIAAQQKVIERHEAAKKSGVRVMSDDERKQRVEELKVERDAAAEEAKAYDETVKTYDESIKAAQAEVAEAQKEADAADAAAKRPPADVEDRAVFVDEKKLEAAEARARAKEAEAKVAEAKQAQADERKNAAAARAKADALAKRMEKPDQPGGDEDKAAAATEADGAIGLAKQEIASLEQAKAFLVDAIAQQKKMRADQKSAVPAANVALLKKNKDKFEAMLKSMQGK